MAEARKFQMHEKLLLDVIMKQAGSIQKAVLEGVMNSIEAGGTKVEVNISESKVSIVDDGKGFCNKKEIELFFETFGQPHDASEGKKWAQFRMGRGQMFAFGKNHWITGQFEMDVDIKAKLGYDLTETKKAVAGCSISIDLYEKINDREIYQITREIERYVKYVNIPVFVNDKQVNIPPEDKKWGEESNDAAYIRLVENGTRLEVYNLGVLVCDVHKSKFGVAGTIISKERLEVNFARNEVIQSCPVWKQIKKAIEASSGVEKIKTKRTLSDDERANMIERLCAGELNVHDAKRTMLFMDVTGTPWSVSSIKKAGFPCYTYAKKGDKRGDKLIQMKQAIVLDEEVLRLFDCKPNEVFTHKWGSKRSTGYIGNLEEPFFYNDKELPLRKFADLVEKINTSHIILPKEKWSRNEFVWHKIAEELQRYLPDYKQRYNDQRRIEIGSSDTADGWTDGETFIAISREFLRRHHLKIFDKPVISGIVALACLIMHEQCHDGDSTTQVHSPEFYKAYHDWSASRLCHAVGSVHKMLSNGGLARYEEAAAKKNFAIEPEPIQQEEEAIAAKATAVKTPVKKTPVAKPAKAKASRKGNAEGRVAGDFSEAADIIKIAKQYRGNDGTLSYEAIENEPKNNLKWAHGNTAYRICKKYAKLGLN